MPQREIWLEKGGVLIEGSSAHCSMRLGGYKTVAKEEQNCPPQSFVGLLMCKYDHNDTLSLTVFTLSCIIEFVGLCAFVFGSCFYDCTYCTH